MTMSMTPKVGIVIFNITMLKQSKGEIWIGLVGLPFPMRAEDIKEAKDGSVSFLRLVESKDGSSRKELIKTHKSQIVYVSETIEVD